MLPHELVDQRYGRTSTETLNAESADISLTLEVLHVVGIGDVVLSKLE